jgi:hypothetical protein
MTIAIQRTDSGYLAQVSPPHCLGESWKTVSPMSKGALLQELIARGCHQTDIGDAFHVADPQWLTR